MTSATGTRPSWTVGRRAARGRARESAPPLVPRLLVAAASGFLATAAFPPYDLWFLAVPAVTLMVLACRGLRARQAAVLGLVHGLALFLPMLAWLRVIGVDAWIALSLLEAAFYAAMACLLPGVQRLAAWPLWTACLWVAQELARATVPFGGFPWGRLAFAETASPYTPYAAVAGAALVTFATALSGSLLALAVVRRARPPVAIIATVAALAIPAAALLIPLPTSGRQVTAAVVQGNVPRPGLHFLGEPEQVLRNHVNATLRLADDVAAGRRPRPDLVIWPENSSDIDPFANPDAGALITQAVDAIGVPVLVGTLVDGPGPDHVRNTGVVWTPGSGPGERYVKRHPVPFGEYIPFRGVLSGMIGRLSMIPRDFYPGHRPGLLQVGPARVGDVICFEIAYDSIVNDVVTGGAQVIVVQTNNATYNNTAQPAQQMAMSRLRAVEHGRSVLIASTSGISALIRPDGSVIAKTRELTAQTLVSKIPLRTSQTLATRLGAWPELLLSAIGVAAAATAVVLARRRRRTR